MKQKALASLSRKLRSRLRGLSQLEYALVPLELDVLAALDDRDPEVTEARAERLWLD